MELQNKDVLGLEQVLAQMTEIIDKLCDKFGMQYIIPMLCVIIADMDLNENDKHICDCVNCSALKDTLLASKVICRKYYPLNKSMVN